MTIYLDRFEFPEALEKDWEIAIPPLENLGLDIESCQAMLKDFRVTAGPQPTQVSACEAAEYWATFVFEHEKIQPTPVQMRTLAIFQKPGFYTLRMYDSPDSGPDQTFDYTAFVESVKMA